MPRKKISNYRKRQIRENISSIKKKDLKYTEEINYFNQLKQEHKDLIKSITIKGKSVKGRIVGYVEKLAKIKKTSVKKYIREHEKDIYEFMKNDRLTTEQDIDTIIDTIAASPHRFVKVDDGNGIVSYGKNQVIKKLVELRQYASSNTTIVNFYIRISVYADLSLLIQIPDENEYKGKKQKGLEKVLREHKIKYIDSPKKKRKRTGKGSKKGKTVNRKTTSNRTKSSSISITNVSRKGRKPVKAKPSATKKGKNPKRKK